MWKIFVFMAVLGISTSVTGGVPQKSKKCPKYEELIFTKYEDPTCDSEAVKMYKGDYLCRCLEGLVRNDKGICIDPCECPKVCPKDEEFIYTKYEDPTCDSKAVKMSKAVEDCRCLDGLVRHAGKCIDPCDCPKKCKGKYEVFIYTKYEDATCEDKPAVACKPEKACRCDKGYVRHEGKCIQPCDCPKKCKQLHEVFIFTKYEDPTCNEDAAKACEPTKACRCEKGFVRHEGKCIEPCDCPKKCKKANEVYIFTKFEDATCDEEAAKACKPGKACRCDKGFVRHEGKCIKPCDCPKKCKIPHEEYIFTKLEDPTCDEDAAKACKPEKACRCEKGFVRHEGKCIEPCDCPKKCKNDHEVFIFTKFEDPTCYEDAAKACEPTKACRCDKGFVRHEGKCIEPCDCPKKCKKANEVYIFTKFEDATCDEEAPKACKPEKACRCDKGFVRHEGKCIKLCDCPKKCKIPHEEYIFTKLEDPTCDEEAAKACKPGKACRCEKGFVRHEGKCIEPCDCPKKCQCDNEVFIFTKFEDPTCDEEAAKACKPVKACRCEEGFVRHNGKCIEPCDCPPKDEEDCGCDKTIEDISSAEEIQDEEEHEIHDDDHYEDLDETEE